MQSIDAQRVDLAVARSRVLFLSTVSFTLLFAVWLMFGILGVMIRDEFSLSAAQLDWLVAVAILAGSLPRLQCGIWADQLGGRLMMVVLLLVTALPTFWVSQARSYPELLVCAALFGVAGNAFTVGVSWNSAWFPHESKGIALGVFGAGNVGASLTKLIAPFLLAVLPATGLAGGLLPGGWRAIPVLYAMVLVAMALILLVLAPRRDRLPGRGKSTWQMLKPLGCVRVWRFSLYYVVVFGAYVALAAWLPRYFMDTHGLTLAQAGGMTALFIFPASLFRPLGGWLSDVHGPRVVTYAVFMVMSLALGILSVPTSILPLGPGWCAALIVVVGCGMGIGKASVYKYIPDYFPNDVGAVGGLVGMLGAMGGFILPPAFGYCVRVTGCSQAAFGVLLFATLVSLAWLHLVVMAMRGSESARVRKDVAVATP